MYPTLFHIPNELPGVPVPVFGLGLLLAVWVVFSVGLLVWLGRQQGFNADTWGYLLLFVPVGAVIWWLLPALCDQYGLPVRGYGVMMLAAVVAATALAVWRARRAGLDPDLILSLAFWMILPGMLGARIFYVIEYWPDQYGPVYQRQGFSAMLGAVVNLAEGGLVVYGSFIGGMLGLLLFVRKFRLPLWATCDLIAPSLILGLALGRVGCLLFGCCFGHICDEDCLWKVSFPWNSPVHIHQAHRGEVFLHGLKITDDNGGWPVIAAVQPGSPAEKQGLKPRQQITEVNGISVATAGHATWALLKADRLQILIEQEDGGTTSWTLEDPPPPSKPVYQLKAGWLWILGLKVAPAGKDPPVIAEVKRGSPADLERLKPGQKIVAVNGRPVHGIQELRSLLGAHRTGPWLSINTWGSQSGVQWTIQRPLPRTRPVHPTQVYSSINGLLLCLFLLAYDPFRRRDGELIALAISIYPVARFLLEMIRNDESTVLGTRLSISQNLSLVMLVCAAGLWFYILRRPRGTAFY